MTRLWFPLLIVIGLVASFDNFGRSAESQSPKPRAMVGAYYFDGWNGQTDKWHLPKLLQTEFADRKPVWGWHANTVEVMRQQIDYAADYGLGFWAFDWYYPEGKDKNTPLNNALDLYRKTPNRDRLKFCLLVANHEGFRIGPADWDACCRIWIDLFREPTHLRVNNKPVLIFFSPDELKSAFGGVQGVHKAFDTMQKMAKDAGLPGVTIAACTGPGEHPELVQSGYTLLTGYNYSNTWMDGAGSKPFQSMIDANRAILDQFGKTTPLPYVPVVTVGWDRRPWEQGNYPANKMSGWYADRTPKAVEDFVRMAMQWLDAHPDKATAERLMLLYAWNENGEGGYLTPTEKDGTAYLKAVQRAICAPQEKAVR